MLSVIPLDLGDLVLAASLLVVSGALSAALRLGLTRSIVVAALRMIVQLSLIGLVLIWLFAVVSPLWTGLAGLVMLGFASYEIRARQTRRFRGLWSAGLGAGSITLAATLVTGIALLTAIRPEPWYHPQYAIPIFGMILGNTMTGISLGLDTLVQSALRERPAIEAQLALGRPRGQAMRPLTRRAMRSGLMPIINAMAATGVVALPGLMTGQILAGVTPAEAVKYQLLIMFLIAGATGFGVLLAVVGGVWRLSDERHRLRLDRLRDGAPSRNS